MGRRLYPAVVVAGAMRGWAQPRPGRPAGSYERDHATGVGVRLYAEKVVAWAVCGWVHDTTERLLVV